MTDYDLVPLNMRRKDTGEIVQIGWAKKERSLMNKILGRFKK